MHRIITKLFDFVINTVILLKVVSVFSILMLLFYWIQNTVHAHWNWLNFITPFLTWLLDFTNNIYSMSFQFLGAVVELKYLSAILLLVIFSLSMHLLEVCIKLLQNLYEGAHFISKKTMETLFNKELEKDVVNKEIKNIEYILTVHTRANNKLVKRGVTVNLEEETNKANKYLSDTFGVKPMLFQGGKLYHFDNIENVDSIIEELLNILKEENPIEFAFCIQLNGDLEKISKLISLQNFNKITACSDTIYRYNLNINHNFKAQSIGVYQYSGDTINVYEIKNNL